MRSLIELLREHARRSGGRYLLYGSAARGDMRYDSDVDLLLDFAPGCEAEAWRLAEELCAENRIEADIKPVAWCAPSFLDRISPDAVVIS